jgi:hypothetical protein
MCEPVNTASPQDHPAPRRPQRRSASKIRDRLLGIGRIVPYVSSLAAIDFRPKSSRGSTRCGRTYCRLAIRRAHRQQGPAAARRHPRSHQCRAEQHHQGVDDRLNGRHPIDFAVGLVQMARLDLSRVAEQSRLRAVSLPDLGLNDRSAVMAASKLRAGIEILAPTVGPGVRFRFPPGASLVRTLLPLLRPPPMRRDIRGRPLHCRATQERPGPRPASRASLRRSTSTPEPLFMGAGSERRAVGAQLVSYQQFRRKPLLSEKLAHQLQRRPAVAATLDQHVKDLGGRRGNGCGVPFRDAPAVVAPPCDYVI